MVTRWFRDSWQLGEQSPDAAESGKFPSLGGSSFRRSRAPALESRRFVAPPCAHYPARGSGLPSISPAEGAHQRGLPEVPPVIPLPPISPPQPPRCGAAGSGRLMGDRLGRSPLSGPPSLNPCICISRLLCLSDCFVHVRTPSLLSAANRRFRSCAFSPQTCPGGSSQRGRR